MKLLLDTHVAVWMTNTPDRIPGDLLSADEDAYPNVFVSVVAVWEIAIKHALGRPDAPALSGHQAIFEFEAAGFTLIGVTAPHAAFVERLPPHHADPFDRLMLAQAIIEGMQFVTYDRHLSRYDVALLTWS